MKGTTPLPYSICSALPSTTWASTEDIQCLAVWWSYCRDRKHRFGSGKVASQLAQTSVSIMARRWRLWLWRPSSTTSPLRWVTMTSLTLMCSHHRRTLRPSLWRISELRNRCPVLVSRPGTRKWLPCLDPILPGREGSKACTEPDIHNQPGQHPFCQPRFLQIRQTKNKQIRILVTYVYPSLDWLFIWLTFVHYMYILSVPKFTANLYCIYFSHEPWLKYRFLVYFSRYSTDLWFLGHNPLIFITIHTYLPRIQLSFIMLCTISTYIFIGFSSLWSWS